MPHFLVILQNAEELLDDSVMRSTIDAIAKEDLFYGADHSQSLNQASSIAWSLKYLDIAKRAGKGVFVVDYVNAPATKADAKRRIEQRGFVPYIAPRDLGALWLPGRNF